MKGGGGRGRGEGWGEGQARQGDLGSVGGINVAQEATRARGRIDRHSAGIGIC